MGRVKGLGPIKKKDRKSARQDHDTRSDKSERDEDRQQGNQGQRDESKSPREGQQNEGRQNNGRNNRRGNKKHDNQRRDNQKRERPPKREIVLTGDPVKVNGMLEIAPKGFGFLRVPEKNYEQCKKDVFVPPDFIRKHGLRAARVGREDRRVRRTQPATGSFDSI